ncbi:MAG: HDOD domain-containing protein [Armatimonadota bacterium]
MEKRIIFVDDELRALEGLKRMLMPLSGTWQMSFARNGMEALALLGREPFDAIVTDIIMPGMDGATLLTEVMRRHPAMVRIALAEPATRENAYRSIGPTHQYLTKPCDLATIKGTLDRAFLLRDRLGGENLRRLIAKIGMLPSMPAQYLEVVRAIESPNSSLEEIGQAIAKDLGMSAKVLHLANSSFFGLRNRVANPAQAVSLLGLDIIKSLIAWFHVAAQLSRVETPYFSFEVLQQHSLRVAHLTQALAAAEGICKPQLDDYFTAGLFHDMGKLIFAANLSKQYGQIIQQAQQQKVPMFGAEQMVFGATHAEVGAYLLALWGFHDPVIEACCYHHRPRWFPGRQFSTVSAVFIANTLEGELAALERHEAPPPPSDPRYLQEMGMAPRLKAWRELARKVRQIEAAASDDTH